MRAYLYLLVPILLWAATPLLVNELSAELPILEISCFATGFSILSLSLTITILRRWSAFRSFSRSNIRTMLLFGAIGLFPYTALYYLAFALAPEAAGNSNIINYLWPIWIVILSGSVLKEHLHWKKLLGIVTSFAGVYLIISDGRWIQFNLEHLPAYLSAGCGAFFWGLFSVLNKRYRFEALSAMLIYSLSAFVCFGLTAPLVGPLIWPSQRSWLLLLLLGGCVNGFGYLFWILALRRGNTAKISNLVYATPFIALVYMAVFRGISITTTQLAALIFILAGPVLQEIRIPFKRKE